MDDREILKKLRSVSLYLIAHPDNEPDSEFTDRISDIAEIQEELSNRQTPKIVKDYLKNKTLCKMRTKKRCI